MNRLVMFFRRAGGLGLLALACAFLPGEVMGAEAPGTSPILAPEKAAAYARSVREEIEWTTQQRVFTLLSEERRGRAEAAERAGNLDQAKWEATLAAELQTRAANAQARVSEAAKQRREFEVANNLDVEANAASAQALGPSLTSAEEALYLERVDQRLGQLQEELGWLQETQRVYVLQLQTNNTPDEVGRVSWLLDDSSRAARDLQRQQSDLQLKKLEFRAIRQARR